jgi:hypothetical protein
MESVVLSRRPSSCASVRHPSRRRCIVAPPPGAAEEDGRVTVAIPSAHPVGGGRVTWRWMLHGERRRLGRTL